MMDIAGAYVKLAEVAAEYFYGRATESLLFGGKIRDEHKTKFAVEQLFERYKQSIKATNRTVVLNVSFTFLALYAYFGLASGTPLTIPLLGAPVTRELWARLCPAVSYVLQLYTFVALIWLMLLRRAMQLLRKELADKDYFGEVSNITLAGTIGSIWLLFSLFRYWNSKWNYVWYGPILLLITLIIVSPSLLCGYFIFELFSSGALLIAVGYSVFIIPSVSLSLLLLLFGGRLGVAELL